MPKLEGPSIKKIINTLRVIAKNGIMEEADMLSQSGYPDIRTLNSDCMNLLVEMEYVKTGTGYGRYIITEKGLAWLYYFDAIQKQS